MTGYNLSFMQSTKMNTANKNVLTNNADLKKFNQTQRMLLMSPNNAQFDTYQKMNSLMNTMMNSTEKQKKAGASNAQRSSLKNNNENMAGLQQTLNTSAMRNMLNETIMTDNAAGTPEKLREASPLARELAKAQGGQRSEEISIIDNKQVNFSAATFT